MFEIDDSTQTECFLNTSLIQLCVFKHWKNNDAYVVTHE